MENNIYSAPNSELDVGEDHTAESDLASRWSRLGASIIDGLTVAPVTIPLMYFTGGFEGVADGAQPSISYTLGIAAIGIVLFILIHGYFLIRDGQTLGKKALGIRIVTLDNRVPLASSLVKRYGFYWVVPNIPVVGPFINILNVLFIFSKSKRCIHDHIGGTRVIQAHKLSSSGR